MSSGASPNYGWPHVSPNSANPEIAVNNAIDAIDGDVKDLADSAGRSVPTGGSTGQVLTRDGTASGYEWADPTGGSSGGGGDTTYFRPFSPPVLSDYPTDFGSGLTLNYTADADTGLRVYGVPVTGDRLRGRARNKPSSGDWTLTGRLHHTNMMLNFGTIGLAIVFSNKVWVWGHDVSRGYVILGSYNPAGGYIGDIESGVNITSSLQWFRFRFDSAGGYLYIEFSPDGKQWQAYARRPASDIAGATGIGFAVGVNRNPRPGINDLIGYTLSYLKLT